MTDKSDAQQKQQQQQQDINLQSTFEDELDWEEWNPSKISFHHHMIAGSAAGLVEHIGIFPIDTIKTYIQYDSKGTINFQSISKQIIEREGFFRLWRGVGAMFAGCIPAHAAYFSVFEAAKSMTGADKPGHYPMQAAFSGSIASLSHDLFITPFDLVKQRMQLGYYDSILHCLKSIVRSEGIRALYVSFPTTVVMNIPYGAVMVAVNESSRKILDPSGRYSLTTSMTAGSIAGAIAAAITNPLDVIKTRLQTQNLQSCPRCSDGLYSSSSLSSSSSSKAAATCVPNRKKSTLKMMHFDNLLNSTIRDSMYYNGLKSGIMGIRSNSSSSNRMDIQPNSKTNIKGIMQIVTTIIAEEGVKGFLRGIVPRVLSHAPSVAISWTAYEAMKSMLSRT